MHAAPSVWYQSGKRSQTPSLPLGSCRPLYRSAPAITKTRATFAEKKKRAKDYSSDSSASEKETEGHSEGRALGSDPSLLTAALAVPANTSIVLEVLDMAKEAVQPMAMAREPMGTVVAPASHSLPGAAPPPAVVVVPGAPVIAPGSVVVEPARAESQVTGQDTKAKMIEPKQMFDEGLITGAELAAKKAEPLKNM